MTYKRAILVMLVINESQMLAELLLAFETLAMTQLYSTSANLKTVFFFLGKLIPVHKNLYSSLFT